MENERLDKIENSLTSLTKRFAELEENVINFTVSIDKQSYYKNGKTDFATLYIAEDTTVGYLYKIGYSSNQVRRETVGNTDNPHLRYIYRKSFKTVVEAKQLELKIHQLLSDFNLQHYKPSITCQEWFVLRPEELNQLITDYGFEKV